MTKFTGMIAVVCVIGAQVASGFDYKKNVISGSGGTTRSSFQSFSSSMTLGGSNATTVTTGTPSRGMPFSGFDWGDGFGEKKTLEERIRSAEQKLHKLYFIRDVCRTLEDEITISFEKKDIREVMKQVSKIKGVEIPFEVPEGTFTVEKSEVAGMPTDEFLNSVANVSGLVLQYAPTKLVFVKPSDK